MSAQIKIDKKISLDAARQLLEKLDFFLNEMSISGLESIDTASCSKLKFNIKLGGDDAEIKLRCTVKNEEDPEAENIGEGKRIKYKSLKKTMKKSFALIGENIEKGIMPPDCVINLFLEQSALMTSIPGYGDEYYAEYDNACNVFKEAHEKSSFPEITLAYDNLKILKKRCHKKYK